MSRLGDALAARLSFLAVRNTLYKAVYDARKPRKATNDLTYREKGVIAAGAGAVGALVSNAFETRMVRRIGDVGRPERFVRADVSHGQLSAGLGAHVLRAALLNGLLTWCYDQMNIRMRTTFGDSFINAPGALLVTAALATVVVLPVDNIKTRLQYAYADPALNRLAYGNKGLVAAAKAFQYEGGYTYFAGAYPFYIRMFIYSLSTVYVSNMLERRARRNSRSK